MFLTKKIDLKPLTSNDGQAAKEVGLLGFAIIMMGSGVALIQDKDLVGGVVLFIVGFVLLAIKHFWFNNAKQSDQSSSKTGSDDAGHPYVHHYSLDV